jgi:hypothetical protein
LWQLAFAKPQLGCAASFVLIEHSWEQQANHARNCGKLPWSAVHLDQIAAWIGNDKLAPGSSSLVWLNAFQQSVAGAFEPIT